MNEERKTEELIEKASQVSSVPDWATHIAVRTNGSKAEPCAWVEKVNDYVDENPNHIKDGEWIGGYKSQYWVFFSRTELNT